MNGDLFFKQKPALTALTAEPWDLRGEVWRRTAGSLVSDGVLSDSYLTIIKEIILRRWQDVAQFRIV